MNGMKDMEEVGRRIVFAVKKRDKYLFKYEKKRAEWTMALDVAHFFHDYEMASNFAGLTKGTVVSIEIIARRCR